MDKDKNRECTENFLKFLYKINEKTNKKSGERALLNKIIRDTEKLLEFYKKNVKSESLERNGKDMN